MLETGVPGTQGACPHRRDLQIIEGLVPDTGRGVVPGQELAGTVGIGAVDLLQSRRDVAVQSLAARPPKSGEMLRLPV